MREFEQVQHLAGFLPHRSCDVMVWLEADAAEESRKHHLKARNVARTGSDQVVRDDSEQLAEFKDIPGIVAEDGERRAGPGERITFACDGFDERRFSTAIRAQDRNVFTGLNAQCNVVQDCFAAAHYGDVLEIEEWRLGMAQSVSVT